MLTEAEKKWLEERKNLCIRCSKRKYCRTGKRHNFNTQDCRFWDVYAPNKEFWHHELRENFKDAAEFEARVANRLARLMYLIPCVAGGCTEHTLHCTVCRLKYARLAVEEEMK